MKEKLSPRMDFTQPKPATALCGVVSADGKIAYPPGVKEITDKITTDEMIKRLKVRVWVDDLCSGWLCDSCFIGLLNLAFGVFSNKFLKIS